MFNEAKFQEILFPSLGKVLNKHEVPLYKKYVGHDRKIKLVDLGEKKLHNATNQKQVKTNSTNTSHTCPKGRDQNEYTFTLS